MWKRRLMWIVWPAFIAAAVLEFGLFALIDPAEINWLGNHGVWSRQTVYTLVFFFLWTGTLLSSALTTLLAVEQD